MGLSLGNKNIGSIYKGNKSIGKVYLGNKLIFQKSAPMVLTTSIFTFKTVGSTNWISPPNTETIEYLVVAGGGAGGRVNRNQIASGGGGGGGVRVGTLSDPISDYSYNIIVGAGGNIPPISNRGGAGGVSRFGSIVAYGGGGGGGGTSTSTFTGGNGGSGGGGRVGYAGGNGTSGQGYNGGDGGGGGAGSAGYDDGTGGDGIYSNITGVNILYGKGGNAKEKSKNSNGINGRGYGGDGNEPYLSTAGGSGGSGIVILKVTHWVPA